MSGNISDALLGGASKKVPLLPPPPKIKKEPKTYSFELKLGLSNDDTYPEFSWAELVRNAKQKDLKKKADKGNPVLDPFASDDEEDLKAMAAKFEAKYNTSNPGPVKKKKRRAEDFIDRGAGYDETDPFIDNTDVYDEVVPPDLQTKHGGFYINSGSLDFKEVELSEEEEDSSQPPKLSKIEDPKPNFPTPPTKSTSTSPKVKNPVGRPPGVLSKKKLLVPHDITKPPKKKRKIIVTPVGPDGATIIKAVNKTALSKKLSQPNDPNESRVEIKKSARAIIHSSSSSSSSGSSSSDDSSSSSGSESSSTEDLQDKKEKSKDVKNMGPPKLKPAVTLTSTNNVQKPKALSTAVHPPPDSNGIFVLQKPNPNLPKKLKTKNVPLNPKLHPNLPSGSIVANPTPTIHSVNSIIQQQNKLLNKDLIKSSNSNINTNPRVHSPSGATVTPTSSQSLRAPTPKNNISTTPSTPVSSGLMISPVTSHTIKLASGSGAVVKQKVKPKPQPTATPQMNPIDIFQSIHNYSTLSTLPNISFSPALASNPPLMKGVNVSMNPQKSMPNLKKLAMSSEKVQQKQPKLAGQIPVKAKTKLSSPAPLPSPPTSRASPLNSGGTTITPTMLSSLAYKAPPPLGGPGVEISKARASQSHAGNSKSISTSRPQVSAATSLALTAASLGLSSANQLSNSAYTSIMSTAASSLVANIPSSLTVQRLPQVTISSSGLPTYSGIDGLNPVLSSSKGPSQTFNLGVADIKPVKHNTAFDVNSLLKGSSNSFPSSVIQMPMSSVNQTQKFGQGKLNNSLNLDGTSRKQ